jgi:hypothetical protein
MSRKVVVTPSGRTYDFGLVYLKQKLGEMDEVVSMGLTEGLKNDLVLLGGRVCWCLCDLEGRRSVKSARTRVRRLIHTESTCLSYHRSICGHE